MHSLGEEVWEAARAQKAKTGSKEKQEMESQDTRLRARSY